MRVVPGLLCREGSIRQYGVGKVRPVIGVKGGIHQ